MSGAFSRKKDRGVIGPMGRFGLPFLRKTAADINIQIRKVCQALQNHVPIQFEEPQQGPAIFDRTIKIPG